MVDGSPADTFVAILKSINDISSPYIEDLSYIEDFPLLILLIYRDYFFLLYYLVQYIKFIYTTPSYVDTTLLRI